MNALGMVEVFGFTTAICCADIAAKAADVKIIALNTNKPVNGDAAEVPLVMNVKMEGSVSAVETAVEAAKAHAEKKGLYITSHIISRPGIGIDYLAYLGNVGNDRWIEELNEGERDDIKKEASAPKPKTARKTPGRKRKPKSDVKTDDSQLTITDNKENGEK